MDIWVETDSRPDSGDILFLEQRLMAYNREQVRGYGYEDVILKVNNDSGGITAGLHGQVGGGWFYVASLWVSESFRGLGLGKALMNRAERLAVENACTGIYLYTYSFQSPVFYQRLGYEIFGTLPDFCRGQAKYYMKKALTAGSLG